MQIPIGNISHPTHEHADVDVCACRDAAYLGATRGARIAILDIASTALGLAALYYGGRFILGRFRKVLPNVEAQ